MLLENLDIPQAVCDILDTLEAAGYETWCVGGAVRDALLGGIQTDVDLATSATPDEVVKLFPRTVPVGVEHGTVGVLDQFGALHEVTTFRRDVRTDGRHAEVEFGVSFADDLARRDFTINAIAFNPRSGEWRDPFGGVADINAGIVRAVGDPDARFREDRLRVLRALRFASRFSFTIEDATWRAAKEHAPETRHLSAERVREEWWKCTGSSSNYLECLRLWQDSGVADAWFEGSGAVPLTELVLGEAARSDPVLLLAAWRQPVEPLLRRLKASGQEIARGRALDRGPRWPADPTPLAVRQWMVKVGAAADDLVALAEGTVGADDWISECEAIRSRGEPTSRAQLALSGDDILGAGLASPGPEMGRLLARLLEAVVADPSLNDRDALLEFARREIV